VGVFEHVEGGLVGRAVGVGRTVDVDVHAVGEEFAGGMLWRSLCAEEREAAAECDCEISVQRGYPCHLRRRWMRARRKKVSRERVLVRRMSLQCELECWSRFS
jgi:hypothetical protein